MGYTHYWTQTRSFTAKEWTEVTDHLKAIVAYTEHDLGIPLADGMGDGGTRPVFSPKEISFNGLGDDSHETFTVLRTRAKSWEGGRIGNDSCKTARKPYDVAVTACLCYLASVTETHSVSSDGNGHDFLAGLDAARKAVPSKANILDIPMDILKKDRWTGPWISHESPDYSVKFCINGRGYVTQVKSGATYSAPREELARFLAANKRAVFRSGAKLAWGSYGKDEPDIWNAYGSFNEARTKRIAGAQAKVLAKLFPVTDAAHAEPPPAYVRPGDMPRPEDAGEFVYSLSDLLAKVDNIAA